MLNRVYQVLKAGNQQVFCMYWVLKAGINVYYWANDIMLTCMYQVLKAGKNV